MDSQDLSSGECDEPYNHALFGEFPCGGGPGRQRPLTMPQVCIQTRVLGRNECHAEINDSDDHCGNQRNDENASDY